MKLSRRLSFLLVTVALTVLQAACGAPMRQAVHRQLEPPPPVVASTRVQPPIDAAPPPVKRIESLPLRSPLADEVSNVTRTAPGSSLVDVTAEATFLNRRLEMLDQLASRWHDRIFTIDEQAVDMSDSLAVADCVSRVEELISQYRGSRDALAAAPPIATQVNAVALVRLYRADLELALGPCGSQAVPAPPASPADVSRTNAVNLEAELADQADRGDFPRVVSTFQQLGFLFPDYRPTASSRRQYGMALLRLGQLDQAAIILHQLVVETALPADPWKMHRLVADLMLATGNQDAATAMYQELVTAAVALDGDADWARDQIALLAEGDGSAPRVIAYTDLLRAFLVFDSERDGGKVITQAERLLQTYPDTIVARNAERVKGAVVDRLNRWLGGQLTLVDGLVVEKKFREAASLLETISDNHLPTDLREMVQTTLDEVLVVEARELEAQRLQREQALAAQWEEANAQMDTMQYDAAIAGFNTLLNTDYDAKARQKINRAVELAVAAKRRQAAALFVKAGRTADHQLKGELLLASRQLLRDILSRYTRSDLVNKVSRNLDILDTQIRRFNPGLLEMADEPVVDQAFGDLNEAAAEQPRPEQDETNAPAEPPADQQIKEDILPNL